MQTEDNAPTAAASAADQFQHLLSELSQAALTCTELAELATFFAQRTRKYFNISGVGCWEIIGDELVGSAADGPQAGRFIGLRLNLRQRSVAADAVSSRTTIVVNDISCHSEYAPLAVLKAESLIVTPLVAGTEVIGAVAFVHESARGFFTPDMAEKATILAAHLGSLIEANRLKAVSREERRRAEVLVRCAQALHSVLDRAALCRELGQWVRELLRAQVVIQYSDDRDGAHLILESVSAESESLAHAIETLSSGTKSTLLQNLDAKARPGARAQVFAIDGLPGLPEAVSSGQMLSARFETAARRGTILVYCGPGHEFDDQEISLLDTIATIAALALSNAELFAKTNSQSKEVQQLLDLSTELGSIGRLDEFLERFVVRAAEFLGFQRSFIALSASGKCEVRWLAENGTAHPVCCEIPHEVHNRVLVKREILCAEDAESLAGAEHEFIDRFRLKQALFTPLLGSDGRVLGMLAALDRSDSRPISPEDARRATALAAGIAVVLEATQNLHLSREHQKRAEELMSLALELSSSIQLSELVKNITQRAASMLHAGSGALALMRGPFLETVFVLNSAPDQDRSILRRLNLALSDLSVQNRGGIAWGQASDLIGASLAAALGWKDLVVVRLTGANEELIGLVCLANRGTGLSDGDHSLLQAILAHASMALDNSRLFSRISQANSHWIEIFDSISDFIVVHDENSHVLRINRSFADFIGARPAELIGASMKALMAIAQDPTDEPCPFCRNGSAHTDEFIHPVLERTYLVSTSTIHAPAHEGPHTIHVLKDITDRREAERRYRELFDNIQEGLFFSTPDGRFIEVNDALVRMLGYENREELLQADIVNRLYASAGQRRAFAETLESKGALRNYEEALIRKDGSVIYTLQNAFAVRDGQGKIVQFRGLVLDITELKNFQAELQRQRDFNLKILNNTQSLILVCDTAGLITYANRRCYEAGGYKAGELVGKRLVDLVAPVRKDALLEAIAQTLTGMQVDNLELPLESKDRTGHFSMNLSPMRDEQGLVTSIVVVMTDITDAAMLQAKLMHTEKMAAVGQLVSGVAHEVNNPLTAILGFADLLSQQPEIPESAKRDLAIIIQEAQRTKVIVQNLLSFARQTPPQREPVQVNDIIRRTLQLRAYDFANHGVEIVQNLQEPMPDVVADPHQLQQVFLNIVNNAYDAITESDRAGRIEVSTRATDSHLEIAFADNGGGIAAPERIFDPFFTTKEVGKGTGLGLSICYGIVREHGGDISCYNRHDQEGAVFIVRLPLTAEVHQNLLSQGASA